MKKISFKKLFKKSSTKPTTTWQAPPTLNYATGGIINLKPSVTEVGKQSILSGSAITNFISAADRIDVTSFGSPTRQYITVPTTSSFTTMGTASASFINSLSVGTIVVSGLFDTNYLTAKPPMDVEEDKLLIKVSCKGGHDYSTHFKKFKEPCPICKCEIKEFSIDSVTFRSK